MAKKEKLGLTDADVAGIKFLAVLLHDAVEQAVARHRTDATIEMAQAVYNLADTIALAEKGDPRVGVYIYTQMRLPEFTQVDDAYGRID